MARNICWLNGNTTILPNLAHSIRWIAALMFVYNQVKEINHSSGSQNTLQHKLKSHIGIIVLLVGCTYSFIC